MQGVERFSDCDYSFEIRGFFWVVKKVFFNQNFEL